MKAVLSGHPRDLRCCPLNRDVRLVQVHFTENKRKKMGLYGGWCPLNAGCPLNTGFTVYFILLLKYSYAMNYYTKELSDISMFTITIL